MIHKIKDDDINYIRAEVFNIFDIFTYTEDILSQLERLPSKGAWDYAMANYNALLNEWIGGED